MEKIKFVVKALLAICLVLTFLTGLLIGINYYSFCRPGAAGGKDAIVRMKGYRFISPLLDYETSPELKNKEMLVLKHNLEEFIADKFRDNQAIYIAVYFRDMLNGPWLGINERDNFAPASLLKVPLLIAYLKYAEQNPEILHKMLTYAQEIKNEARQNITPDKGLELGKSYSVDDLLVRMVAYSDNIAKDLLLSSINADILDKVYTDLGIILPDIRNKSDFITVKEYSSFFRILFNASYLNKEMSEKALEILSKSTFKMGLAAGVPADIPIAHKFAERGDLVTQAFQLHDCGIIYHKERPYLLCVMTYGKDFKALSDIIKGISAIVYKNVDGYYKKL